MTDDRAFMLMVGWFLGFMATFGVMFIWIFFNEGHHRRIARLFRRRR